MQKITFKSLAVTVVAAFCFVMVGSFASAAPSARAEEARMHASEHNNSTQTKSTEAKLAACKKREVKISAAMMRIAERCEKQLAVFDKIA